MEIIYLKELQNYPMREPKNPINKFEIQGLSLPEIVELEQNWNSGNPFPKALRELLYLAGTYCYVLDYNVWENQQDMQEMLRMYMQRSGHSFSRPFFIVDNYGGGGPGQFLFVYLDEDQNDPKIYEYSSDAIDRGRVLDRYLGYSLSHLINLGITAVKEGRNPM